MRINELNMDLGSTFNGTCSTISIMNGKKFAKAKTSFTKGSFTYRNSNRKFQIYVFLGLIVLLPTTMSAPTATCGTSSSDPYLKNDKPYWTNPCPGVPTLSAEKHSSEESLSQTQKDFIHSLYKTAERAKNEAEKFKDEYVNHTFKTTFSDIHNIHKNRIIQNLTRDEEIPKELNKNVSVEHLKKIELQEESLKLYKYMQRLAIAFEQLIEDQRACNSKFTDKFENFTTDIRLILCDFRDIIDDEKMKSIKDETRDILEEKIRHEPQLSHRHVRDWLIFRDYINAVQYITQIMNYFVQK